MSVAPCDPESPKGVAGEHSTVLHDRRRPGRREVAPELIPLLRGQGPVLVGASADIAAEAQLPALALRDDLGAMSGIMRGLGVASLGWAAVAILVLY